MIRSDSWSGGAGNSLCFTCVSALTTLTSSQKTGPLTSSRVSRNHSGKQLERGCLLFEKFTNGCRILQVAVTDRRAIRESAVTLAVLPAVAAAAGEVLSWPKWYGNMVLGWRFLRRWRC